MTTNRTAYPSELSFGQFLRDRRIRLEPAAFGYAGGRRRTPGLRREEVAQRAAISPTWYSWLEQGRGGAPSAHVVERLARALVLTDAEREHLFLLALGRPPEVRPRPQGGITPRLQRVLDAMELCPALIRTAAWDVVAWNTASAVVQTDWSDVPPSERNLLRRFFLHPDPRKLNHDWAGIAHYLVGMFRGDVTRAGAGRSMQPFVDRLCAESPEFAALWQDANVAGLEEGEKRMRHPAVGSIAFEYSSFLVDGRTDLIMLVHTPVATVDEKRIQSLLRQHRGLPNNPLACQTTPVRP